MSLLIFVISIGVIIFLLVLIPVRILGWMIVLLIGIFPFYNIWIMQNCSGECNIRLDLVILIPILSIILITWGVRKYLSGRKMHISNRGTGNKNSKG